MTPLYQYTNSTKMTTIANAWKALYDQAIKDIVKLETDVALMEAERGESTSSVLASAEALIHEITEKDAIIAAQERELKILKARLKWHELPIAKTVVTPISSTEQLVWDDVDGCWIEPETV